MNEARPYRMRRVVLLGAVLLGALATRSFADPPAPDPTGAATGDRTSVVDAAGNPLVVPPPPDPTDAAYADKKKAFVFAHELIRRGVYCTPGGKLYLSLAHSDEDIDRIVSVAAQALAAR